MLQIGSLLDDKYRILSVIGRGGMSVVYLAINERANKTWAVKEVRKEGVIDFETVKQGLAAEVDMLKKLKHPFLPSIIDVLDYEDSFVIVMDYVEGLSLSELLKSEGPQPEKKAVRWARQLCNVIGYLHRQDPPIIYRDIKPSNIMLKPDGNITLIDFGTAREFKNRNMIEDTVCLGTRGYAAPEQFGGRGQSDCRTDIYCMGTTLYHLITGHCPAEPPYEIKPISCWMPAYAGSGLEKLILKCTKQDPSERYQSCDELMYALRHYKEEDESVIMRRKKARRRFAAGIAVGFIGLVGAIGSALAIYGAKRTTYEANIEMASCMETLDDAEEYLNKALELDPGAAEAYLTIMNFADNDILKNDGRLTSETANMINGFLKSMSSGSVSNEERLKTQNPYLYTKIMYDLGIDYFFLKDNTAENKKVASENCFANIQDEKYAGLLKPEQAELSAILFRIGSYITSMNTNISKYKDDSEQGSNYRTMFDDYSQIVSGDLKSRVEKDIYCIKIYEHVAYEIAKDFENYISDGVSKDELQDILNTINGGLDNLDIKMDNPVFEDRNNAKKTVGNAMLTVSASKV